MVSGKTPKYQYEQFLDLSFLFTVQNVVPGYTLCPLENCFFLLYVCFKIGKRKTVVSPINWNIEKNTPLNTEGLKGGSKKTNLKIIWIFHFT